MGIEGPLLGLILASVYWRGWDGKVLLWEFFENKSNEEQRSTVVLFERSMGFKM